MLLFLFSLAHLGTYFQWTEEELEANWKREPMNIQQRIADKCRNLNKKRKTSLTFFVQVSTLYRLASNAF